MIQIGNPIKPSNFSSEEWEQLIEATRRANEVLRSQAFAVRVLGFKFTTTQTVPQEILNKLIDPVWAINVFIQSYPWWNLRRRNEIAREGNGIVILNRKFWAAPKGDVASRAGTVAHEACHAAGFSHASASDRNSVPYTIGRMVQELVRMNGFWDCGVSLNARGAVEE